MLVYMNTVKKVKKMKKGGRKMCNINKNIDHAIKQLIKLVKLEKRETGIFISKDCIVTETFTGKTYKYKVYNYRTGESKYLGYKKKAINTEKYIELLSKVVDQCFYNVTYPTEGEELIEYIFNKIFKCYGFEIRREQVELSKHMYRTMISNRILLSDVAVGLGKTHAYLVACIVYDLTYKSKWSETTRKASIVISTSSKRLQREIVKEYLPQISKILLENGIIDKQIKAVIRKGKENYICDIRLENYVRSLRNKNKKEYNP